MPTFVFTSPEGEEYEIEGPEGATEDQAFQMLQQRLNPPGVLDKVGAVPQTAYNMLAGFGAQAAGGLAGVWNLIRSGGDFEEASGAIKAVSEQVANTLKIEASKTGQDIETWIGDKIDALKGSTEQQLIAQGIPEIHARNLASAGVDTALTLLPLAPKAIKGTAKGVGKVGKATLDKFAKETAALDKPMPFGRPPVMEPPFNPSLGVQASQRAANKLYGWAENRSGSSVPTPSIPPIAPPTMGDVAASDWQKLKQATDKLSSLKDVELKKRTIGRTKTAPFPRRDTRVIFDDKGYRGGINRFDDAYGKVYPPTPPEVTVPVVEVPVATPQITKAKTTKRPTAQAPLDDYGLTVSRPKSVPDYHHNAISNVIDTPMYRAIRVTGGENHPIVAGLRKLESDTILKRQEFQPLEVEYATAVSKLSRGNRKAYKDALLSGDTEGALNILSRSRTLKNRANADTLMTNVKTALDKRYADTTASGVEQAYLAGYHPRKILDPRGFAKEFEAMMKEKGKENIGSGVNKLVNEVRTLSSQLEKGEIEWAQYQNAVDKLLTGDAYKKIIDPKGIHSKERSIKAVPKRLQKYYADPGESLAEYFSDTARVLAEREFLGKGWKNVEDGISNRLASELQRGTIDPAQFREFKKILEERFNPTANRGGSKAVRAFKDVGYAGTLGNTLSAGVQILDLIPSSIKYGVLRTLGGAGRHVLGRTGLVGRLDPRKLGLYETAHEIGRSSALDKVLRYSGFKAIDRFGKGTVLNAARSKLKSLASSKKGIAKLEAKGWRHIHRSPEQWKEFTDALKKGDFDNPMVQEAAIAELLDMQPIALSSMPISYLRHPNGRVFYMLKTWAIRQLNTVRESYQKGQKGTATALAAGVLASNMAAPHVRDILTYMFGTPKERPEQDLKDQTVSALLRSVIVDKWATDKAITTGRGDQLVGSLMSFPAVDMVLGTIKEAVDYYNDDWSWEDSRVKRYLPFVGAISARLED